MTHCKGFQFSALCAAGALCLGLLVWLNIFQGMGVNDIRNWDEARHGVSALEMAANGDFIVNTFQGRPDYWNLKPPLAFASMAAGFELFGRNLWGLRFFSGVLTVLTICITAAVCAQRRSPIHAFLASLILLTCLDYFSLHNAASGDADALYNFFYAAALCLILGLPKGFGKYYAASLIAALAFLTKSFHAASLCLTIAILFAAEHRLRAACLARGLACLLCFAAPVGLWAALRHAHDGTAFFESMIMYDLLARSGTAIEGHQGPPWYYAQRLFRNFNPWLFAAVGAGLLGLAGNGIRKTATALAADPLPAQLAVIIAVPLIAYSAASSKLTWYIYCVYPFIAALLALPVAFFFRTWAEKKPVVAGAAALLVALVALQAERMSIEKRDELVAKHRDVIQERIASAGRQCGAAAVHLYLDKGEWEQRHILAAMLAGDVVLLPGGESGFRADQEGCKALLKAE